MGEPADQRGGPKSTRDLPQPGQLLAGKYVVESIIGQGGMGYVVAAHHRELGQPVAIKFLREEALTQTTAVERFLREARAVVAFKSEHVAKVSDVGRLESGAPYMVMERLVGDDLAEVLERRTRLGVAEAIDYVVQAAEALAEAHSHGIIHRDLKPSNLFLTRRSDGSAFIKLLDFGIAKTVTSADALNLTVTGSALGTPMYMSPEQIRGAKAADFRTDIWGLGTTLYELLTGAPPFDADTMPALCAMIVTEPPPPLASVRKDVPAGVVDIVERCLAKSPDDRFQDVAEFARAIAPWAPLRCQMILERIVRVVEGSGATIGWAERDSRSETRALGSGTLIRLHRTGGDIGEEETEIAPRHLPSSDPPAPRVAASESVDEQPAPSKRRGWLALALAAVVGSGLLVWLATPSSQPSEAKSVFPLPSFSIALPPAPPAGLPPEPPSRDAAPEPPTPPPELLAPRPVKQGAPKPAPGKLVPKPEPSPKGDDLDAISERY